jgi:hypothetical protein
MKIATVLTAALLASAATAPAFAADLIGVQTTATLLYPNQSTIYAGPVTATVGAQVEFPAGAFSPAFGSFDIDANTVTFISNQNGLYGTSAFNGYRLDFANRVIVSLTLDGSSTFTPVGYSFSGSSIFINVSGQDPRNGNSVFNVGVAAVPEPATWAMMMLGFGMVGYGLRRGRKSVVTTRVAFA